MLSRVQCYWAAFLGWSLLAIFLYSAEPIEGIMTVYVLTSFLALMLMHSVEKRRYLERLKEIEPDNWRALTTSASYKWLGALSPVLLRYVFSRTPAAVQRLEDTRRSYRRSEIFSYVAVVVIVLIYAVVPAFER